ncbi:MAG: DUF4097 domain-containing protein [Ignavibacteriaceae bacterium]|nr:DUF4097 domain-containing protein [Ignavibacteriaceae bacterium]
MKLDRPTLITVTILLFSVSFSLSACSVAFNGDNGSKKLSVIDEKTFQISSGKTLRVDTRPGDVMITPWEKDEVYIKVYGNDKAREKMKFDFNGNSNEVAVTGKYERSFFNWGNSGIKVRYEIKTPSNFNVTVSTAGGDVRVGGIKGSVTIKTSGGDVDIKETRGNLLVATSGGDITLENPEGNTKASTSGGDINGVNYKGNLKVTTSGGDIKLSGGNGSIEAKSSGGDIKLEYNGINEGIALATSGGDIDIYVPADFKASLMLSSSGGGVDSDFKTENQTNRSKRKLEGDINGGGPKLVAKTSGGEINLRKR